MINVQDNCRYTDDDIIVETGLFILKSLVISQLNYVFITNKSVFNSLLTHYAYQCDKL